MKKEIEEAREAEGRCRQDLDQVCVRLQVARQEVERANLEIAAADVDGPGFAQLVAAREVARTRTEVLEPRTRRASERLREANQKIGRLELATEQERERKATAAARAKRKETGWEL
jgi:hypothetical protein